MITTSCHCVLIDACAAPCTSRQSKSMHMCLMRRSTESSSARGGLVSCTRSKNITCFPSANAHVGPARSSITLAFEARLARDAWSHQFEELRAVPAVCLTRADEISSQHAARPSLRLATGSSSLRGSITPKFGPLRPVLAKMTIAYGYFSRDWGYIPLGRTFALFGRGRGGACRSLGDDHALGDGTKSDGSNPPTAGTAQLN